MDMTSKHKLQLMSIAGNSSGSTILLKSGFRAQGDCICIPYRQCKPKSVHEVEPRSCIKGNIAIGRVWINLRHPYACQFRTKPQSAVPSCCISAPSPLTLPSPTTGYFPTLRPKWLCFLLKLTTTVSFALDPPLPVPQQEPFHWTSLSLFTASAWNGHRPNACHRT